MRIYIIYNIIYILEPIRQNTSPRTKNDGIYLCSLTVCRQKPVTPLQLLRVYTHILQGTFSHCQGKTTEGMKGFTEAKSSEHKTLQNICWLNSGWLHRFLKHLFCFSRTRLTDWQNNNKEYCRRSKSVQVSIPVWDFSGHTHFILLSVFTKV